MSETAPTPIEAVQAAVQVFVLVASVPILILWRAFVLAVVWNWFAWPFTAVRLSIPLALGLLCLIDAIKGHRYSNKKSRRAELWDAFQQALYLTGILLLTAAIAHHFVVAH